MALILSAAAVLPTPAGAASAPSGFFTPTSGRLVDTRNSGGPWAAGSWHTVSPNGQLGIPTSGATAVAVTFTALAPASAGRVSALAASATKQTTSTALYWNAGETISNSGVVASDGNGNFQVYVSTAAQLIIDVQGYYSTNGAATSGGYVPLPNGGTRIFDSRVSGSTNGHLNAGGTYTVASETSSSGVPSNATAVFANITVVSYTKHNSFLTAWPADATRPLSSLNFLGGTTTALGSVLGVDSAGQFSLYVSGGAVDPIDVVVDIEGYYTGAATPGAFTAQTARVYDSRTTAKLIPGSTTRVQVANLGGIPSTVNGVAAEIVNVEVISHSAKDTGYLRLWGTNQQQPSTSTVNLAPGAIRSNLATVVPGTDDSIFIGNHEGSGSTPLDVAIDVQGWYVSSSTAAVPGAPQSVSATASDSTATVSFNAPTNNGGAPITSYTVIANPNGQVASSTGSPIVITGLHNGTTYSFTVRATNNAGTGAASAVSNPVTPAPVADAPSAPRSVTATAQNAAAAVSFSPPSSNGGAAVSSYTATSSPSGIKATASSSPITVKGLHNGTTYTFTVTATNAAGTGPASAPSNRVTPAPGPTISCYQPSNHCWGIDKLSQQTASDMDGVKSDIGDGSYPDFVGRYITRGAAPAPLDSSEVSMYRSKHIALELLADKTGGCSSTAAGQDEADSAATAADHLGLPSGTPVAIFLDEDEPGVDKTATCERAYADELTSRGYQPGYYLNPHDDSGSAYCSANDDPNVAGAVVFSDEPEPSGVSTHRNSSPSFNPEKPACGSGTNVYGWQYSLDENNPSDYDLDEIAPDRTAALWLP